MKVAALFTDYDGTIAQEDLPRALSRVPKPVASRLELLSRMIPLAIVTSKDLAFVRPRTPFARAWACAMGMEVRLSDGMGYVIHGDAPIESVLQRLKPMLPPETDVEEKKASDGTLLGFSLDWSGGSSLSGAEIARLEGSIRSAGLYVLRTEGHSYIDAFAAPADKGSAVRTLVRMLGITGPLMYMGNSEPDNEAFDESDISVGVYQSEPDARLHCRFSISYADLPELLGRLLDNELEFSHPLLDGGGITP